MEKQELIEEVKKIAINDALISEDDFTDLEDKDELFDIADDAWNHSGYICLQEDEKFEDSQELIDEIISELNEVYAETFVNTVIKEHELKF